MKVLLLSRYGYNGASSRYRSFQYIPLLTEQGFEFTVAPLLDDNYIQRLYSGKRVSVFNVGYGYVKRVFELLRSHHYDLIWIEKEAFPWVPFWLESLLYNIEVPYIVDYDDAVFHRYDQHPSKLVRKLLSDKIDKVMSKASLVIAGNSYLAERAYNAGAKRVEIVPTVIDLTRYPNHSKSSSDIFKIGWIGSPSTSKYLKVVRPVIKSICEDRRVRLVLVGAGEVDFPDVQVQVIPWSEKTEVQHMLEFDVGIMPLPDGPWERGKCGFKLIQYMGCRLPVVASPVGVNAEIVDHGQNGYLAQTQDQWRKYLFQLLEDKQLRVQMGNLGRRKVEQLYSLQVTSQKIKNLLQEVTI